MNITELIKQLEALKAAHGDLPIHEAEYGLPVDGAAFMEEWQKTRGEGSPCTLKNIIII